MKKILTFILILFSLFFTNKIFAEKNTNIFKNLNYKKNVLVGEKWEINLQKQKKQAEKFYKSRIIFEWDITWESTKSWPIFLLNTKNFWEKTINLTVYKVNWLSKTSIFNTKINVFVYKTAIPFIIEKNLEEKFKDYSKKAKESWILTYNLASVNNYNLYKLNILEKYYNFEKKYKKTSNYLTIWGQKDFLFDVISKINKESSWKKINDKINLVLISSFNINILESYLKNFISNKNWIWEILLLDETSKYELLKQPESIKKLENEIKNNKYNFINLTSKEKISKIFFISNFINYLSNNWFSTQNIYLIIIIPFLLLWVSVFKHILWFPPIWILIPTTITISMLKFWIIVTLILLIVFLITNLLLSKIINKYNMHYTPKISMLTIINILVFIITLNILSTYQLIKIDINDIMFFIFFILVAEKLITIIIWKEFNEYKQNLSYTIIFAFISFIIFKLNFIKTIILSYPEIIILLIPILFMIWRFTWLRISEYFRFKEVIKNIEE